MGEKIVIRTSYKDNKNFTELPELRKGVIEQAPDTPLTSNFSENAVANLLHPKTQFLKVKQVAELSKNLMAYVLEPDKEEGTAKLPMFRPGQSLNFSLEIKDDIISKDFIICSSPQRSLKDEYVVIVPVNKDDYILKFINENWKVGVKLTASSPIGEFYHQALRDPFHIVGICDNDGFEPFLSMAESICDGSLKADLSLLYTARKQRDVPMFEHLNDLARDNKRFKVIYIFSDELVFKCERGFITKSVIEKYKPNNKFSVFINGNPELLNKLLPQLEGFGLLPGNIRLGPASINKKLTAYPDYPPKKTNLVFLCKIYNKGEYIATVPCPSDETLLKAFEKDGLIAKIKDSNIDCELNRIKLTEGEIYIPQDRDKRKKAEALRDIIYPDQTYPLSNITVNII